MAGSMFGRPRARAAAALLALGLALAAESGSAKTTGLRAAAGLVAAYSMDAGAGTTLADDSGSGNTGTISGATWAAGKFGRALSFDGTNDWVTVADSASLDLAGAMTLEAWVRPTSLGSVWRDVLIKEQPGELVYGLYASSQTALPYGIAFTQGAERQASGGAALPLNTWTHLAATYDGTVVRLFVNGVQAGTVAASDAMPSSTGPLRLGGNAVWGEWFSGLVDEVRIYDRALSADEIQSDLNTPISTPLGPVAAYSFDAGSGSTLADDSGNGNAGSITEATWAAGKFGSALRFDGSNDVVTIPDAPELDLSSALTVEAWVNPDTLGFWKTVAMKEQPGNLTYGLFADSNTAQPTGNVYIGGQQIVRGSSAVPLGTWTHLATTYDGSTMRVYVNGTQVGSRAQTGAVAVSADVLRIGGNTVYANEFLDGLIDEVRIYNRALSAVEIQADMNTPIGVGAPPPPPPPPPPSPPPPPPPPADSASVFLSPAGSDTNPCSAVSPCRSLDRGYRVAAPGQTVELAGGSYSGGNVNSDASKTSLSDVVFRPAAGASVTISSSVAVFGSHMEFRDMKFAGGWNTYPSANDVTFRNISMRHFFLWSSTSINIIGGEVGPSDGSDYDSQITEYSGSRVAPRDILIDGVAFHDWWRPPGSNFHTECLQVGAGVNVTIRNSRFWNCATHDIFIRSWGGINGGIHELKGWLIENNFFAKTLDGFYAIQFVNDLGFSNADFLVRNNSFLQGIYIDGPTTTVTVDSNIFSEQATWGCSGDVYRYNIYETLQGTGGPCGATDRVASVQYVNRAALDLHLRPGSPGIDQGNPNSFPATDIDGQARPRGAAPDVGADET